LMFADLTATVVFANRTHLRIASRGDETIGKLPTITTNVNTCIVEPRLAHLKGVMSRRQSHALVSKISRPQRFHLSTLDRTELVTQRGKNRWECYQTESAAFMNHPATSRAIPVWVRPSKIAKVFFLFGLIRLSYAHGLPQEFLPAARGRRVCWVALEALQMKPS